jgi:hypothetical protein
MASVENELFRKTIEQAMRMNDLKKKINKKIENVMHSIHNKAD